MRPWEVEGLPYHPVWADWALTIAVAEREAAEDRADPKNGWVKSG